MCAVSTLVIALNFLNNLKFMAIREKTAGTREIIDTPHRLTL